MHPAILSRFIINIAPSQSAIEKDMHVTANAMISAYSFRNGNHVALDGMPSGDAFARYSASMFVVSAAPRTTDSLL